MGDSQIDALHIKDMQAFNRLGQICGVHFNGQVAPVQSQGLKGGFLHDNGRILSHRMAENSHQFSFVVCFPGHNKSLLVKPRQRCCSISL